MDLPRKALRTCPGGHGRSCGGLGASSRWGLGSRVEGLRFRVEGLGLRV